MTTEADYQRALAVIDASATADLLQPYPGHEHVPCPRHLVRPDAVRDTQADARFVPVQVTAHLRAPIGGETRVMLDGIVATGVYLQYMDLPWHERWHLPDLNTSAWLVDFDLPLATWTHTPRAPYPCDARLLTPAGEVWGWCASQAQAEWVVHGIDHTRGTPPVGAMLSFTDASSVDLAAGEYKAIQLPIELHTPKDYRLTWHALAEPDALRDALLRVTQIGKRSRTGHGALQLDAQGLPRWEVTPAPDDTREVWWQAPDGTLRRAMPWGWRDAPYMPTVGAVRAPYYHASRMHYVTA